MEKTYSVYMHIFPNSKVYIGMTARKPEKRWHYGGGYYGSSVMSDAIKQYDWKDIKHIILKENLTKLEAEYYEQYYIELYRSNDINFGYNSTSGGTIGTKVNVTTREKYSNNRKGIQFSVTHKKSISISLKNYFSDTANEAQIAKMKYNDMMSSPKRKPVRCIETNIIYPSIRNAGKLTGINHNRIAEVCHKYYGRKTAGGFHWEFYERSDDLND